MTPRDSNDATTKDNSSRSELPSAAPAGSGMATSLHAASCGKDVRVVRLEAEHGVCQRLNEMGFCENASIKKLAHGGALLCCVCGVRVAISARLAEMIVVQEIGAN
jgi:ferrous iron transport protein A